MFQKAVRLTDSRLYEAVFRKGTWVRGRFFSLVHIPARGTGRIGFIITKKVTKSAVLRNRTKRRLREAFLQAAKQPETATLMAKKNIVVVIHQMVIAESYQIITAEVDKAFRKLAAQDANK